MAVARKSEPRFTPEEYLAQEEAATQRHEYFRGDIYALAGGSVNHNRIAGNLNARFNISLRKTPCEAFTSDMRLLVKAHNLYTYPDAMIVCGKLEFARSRNDTIVNPSVIVEVLSPSTQDYDRGQKFELYRAIPTLADYVLVHQDRIYVEYYHRQRDGRWLLTEIGDIASELVLQGVEISIPLREIYDRVDWLAEDA